MGFKEDSFGVRKRGRELDRYGRNNGEGRDVYTKPVSDYLGTEGIVAPMIIEARKSAMY